MPPSTDLPTAHSVAAAVADRTLGTHKKLATQMSQKEIVDLQYWKELLPFLTICKEEIGNQSNRLPKPEVEFDSTLSKAEKPAYWRKRIATDGEEPKNLPYLQYKIKHDGYCVVPEGPGVEDGHPVEKCHDEGAPVKRRKVDSVEGSGEQLGNEEHKNALSVSEKNLPVLDRLRLAAYILKTHGWPATFLAVYDEAWELAQTCQKFINHLTESEQSAGGDERISRSSSSASSSNTANRLSGNTPLPPWLLCFDVVGFFVENGKGFSPHRDRQPEDWQPNGHPDENPRATFTGQNGSGYAKYLTCWVALEEASPSSSCLYYVNARADEGYFNGDSNDEQGLEPMEAVFTNHKQKSPNSEGTVSKQVKSRDGTTPGTGKSGVQKSPESRSDAVQEVINRTAFQHIRAAPVPKGGMVCHTHRVIHWGGAGDNFDDVEAAAQKKSLDANKPNSNSPVPRNFIRPPPRIALSFAFTNNVDSGVFEPPFFKNPEKMLPYPEFEARVALCCGQIINYSTLIIGDKEGWVTVGGGSGSTTKSAERTTTAITTTTTSEASTKSSASTLGRQHLGRFFAIFQKNASKLFSATYIREVSKKFVEVSMSKEIGGSNGNVGNAINETNHTNDTIGGDRAIGADRDEDSREGGKGESPESPESPESETLGQERKKEKVKQSQPQQPRQSKDGERSKTVQNTEEDDEDAELDELALEAMLQNAVEGGDAGLGDDLDDDLDDDLGGEGCDFGKGVDFGDGGDGFSDDDDDDDDVGKPEAWLQMVKGKKGQKKVDQQVSKEVAKQKVDKQKFDKQKGKHKISVGGGVGGGGGNQNHRDHDGEAGFKKYSKAERRAHNKQLKAAKKESRMVRKNEAKARWGGK